MEIKNLFSGSYLNRKVLVTGHTGFKGSWLTLWLTEMGAEVAGLSIDHPTNPSHGQILNNKIKNYNADLRSFEEVMNVFNDFSPEIIFHLAAQPMVKTSFEKPLETFMINAIGTANVLEAARLQPSVKALVNVTTDKVYQNNESAHGYIESDPLGGNDPYSASKACSELITRSYYRSFLKNKNCHVATARAGNVIGGGDWGDHRLIPDAVKAAAEERKVSVRNPAAIRPWQYVLEPLSGYLLLGEKLFSGDSSVADAWNFGPEEKDNYSVEAVLRLASQHWNKIQFEVDTMYMGPEETKRLSIDSFKARQYLKWKPVWSVEKGVAKTIEWYKEFYRHNSAPAERSKQDLYEYLNDAYAKQVSWAGI